jgi:hypothetical protein
MRPMLLSSNKKGNVSAERVTKKKKKKTFPEKKKGGKVSKQGETRTQGFWFQL